MSDYNYLDAVKDDIREYLADNDYLKDIQNLVNDNYGYADEIKIRDQLEERLNDELWIEDSITGNSSGSYTFNREKAKEYVLSDIDTVIEAYREFGEKEEFADDMYDENWEKMDVTARCYMLGEALSDVLDEHNDDIQSIIDEKEAEPTSDEFCL